MIRKLQNAMATPPPTFLIVDPHKGRKRDIFNFLFTKNEWSGMRFLDGSDEGVVRGAVSDHRWILLVSVIIRRILAFINTPLMYLGYVVDFFLNLISQNGGVSGILCNSLQGIHTTSTSLLLVHIACMHGHGFFSIHILHNLFHICIMHFNIYYSNICIIYFLASLY